MSIVKSLESSISPTLSKEIRLLIKFSRRLTRDHIYCCRNWSKETEGIQKFKNFWKKKPESIFRKTPIPRADTKQLIRGWITSNASFELRNSSNNTTSKADNSVEILFKVLNIKRNWVSIMLILEIHYNRITVNSGFFRFREGLAATKLQTWTGYNNWHLKLVSLSLS